MASSAASGASSNRVAVGLYRSLLRAARPFDGYGGSPSPSSSGSAAGRILSSLLHRTGIDHDDEHASYVAAAVKSAASARRAEERRSREAAVGGDKDEGVDDDYDYDSSSSSPSSYREVHLPREYARDLSRPYRDLQRTRWRHQRGVGHPASLLFDDDDEDDDNFAAGTPSHEILFRGLLREALGGGPALMRFPSQVGSVSGGDGADNDGSLRELIRREFRAGDDPSDWRDADLLSSCFDERTRVKTAFLSLRELNRKLRYAECHGLDLRRRHRSGGDDDTSSETEEEGEVAGDAAEAEEEAEAAAAAKAMESARRRCGVVGSEANRSRNRRQAARDVRPLPLSVAPTSTGTTTPSYLRPGTYLVAHPLVDGFFARSVIVLLDHTEEGGAEEEGSGRGGTYGVIVNKPVAPMDPSAAREVGRNCATMEEVIRTVPHGLRVAFGDAAVRNGGPVNAALQMIHTCSPEQEERVRIGGNVLPMVDLEMELDATATATAGTRTADATSSTVSPAAATTTAVETAASASASASAPQSTALTTDHAVYFQGDPIRAAQAVLSGDVDKTDVSFLVGASCWTVGQLESEVAKGWWMPCRGPPRIALTGRCEHEHDHEDSVEGDVDDVQRPLPPPPTRDDLWLSMMCALGQEEGDLAHLLLAATDGGAGGVADGGGEASSYDENGEPCDDF